MSPKINMLPKYSRCRPQLIGCEPQIDDTYPIVSQLDPAWKSFGGTMCWPGIALFLRNWPITNQCKGSLRKTYLENYGIIGDNFGTP